MVRYLKYDDGIRSPSQHWRERRVCLPVSPDSTSEGRRAGVGQAADLVFTWIINIIINFFLPPAPATAPGRRDKRFNWFIICNLSFSTVQVQIVQLIESKSSLDLLLSPSTSLLPSYLISSCCWCLVENSVVWSTDNIIT